MITSWPSYKSAAFSTALSNEIFLCGYLEANKYPNCIVYCMMILRENISVLWESLTGIFFIARASVYGKPESENATDFLAKRGVMVPGVPGVPYVPGVDHGNLGRERDIARSWHNSVFCEESFGKLSIVPYTFISHIKMPIFFYAICELCMFF